MSSIESQMFQLLRILKDNHGAISLKSEFESEGATLEETVALKQVADEIGLGFTIKIGGCEAIRDLRDIKQLCPSAIVAPMIESSYALEKFVHAVKRVLGEKDLPELFINIETVTGYRNFESILFTHEASSLKGIVLGRSDMCASLGLNPDEVNSDKMQFFVNQLAEKTAHFGKLLTIGGRISPQSLHMIKKIHSPALKRIETRKVIFDFQKLLLSKEPEKSIEKALLFELLWLENKNIINNEISDCDKKRIETIKSFI